LLGVVTDQILLLHETGQRTAMAPLLIRRAMPLVN
jgi:hypothetical protein